MSTSKNNDYTTGMNTFHTVQLDYEYFSKHNLIAIDLSKQTELEKILI